MNIQIIEHNGAPEYAIVPFREWETIIDRLEELEDIRDARTISAAIAAGEETYPHEFVKRLSSEENPLRYGVNIESSPWQRWPRRAAYQSRPCPRSKTISAPPAWIYCLGSPRLSAATWRTLSGWIRPYSHKLCGNRE